MEKKKEFYTSLLLLILIFFYAGIKILNQNVGNMDEIWSYNFANCIANNLVPYKDFNLVTTPFLPMLVSIFLKIYNSLLTMRIISIIISSLSLFLIYKILNKLKLNNISIICTLLISLYYFNYYYLEYNFFCLLLNLLIIYLELKDKKNDKHNLLIGILAGLVFASKQTVGVLTCLAILFYQLIINYKMDKKLFNKTLLYKFVGMLIPVILLLIYFIATNSLYDFINYTFLGITTFSNNINYTNLIINGNILVKILAIYIPLSYILHIYLIIKKKDKPLLVITTISLAMLSLVYPIADVTHFAVAIIISLVASIYSFSILLKNKIKFNFKYITITSLILFTALTFTNAYKIKDNYYSNLNHFKYLPIKKELEDQIKILDNYIENTNKKVYILNSNAALFMIPLNRYNKNYDLFMNGNFGVDGQNKIIEDIKKDDAFYLVSVLDKNWQHPHEITNYIEDNFTKIDQILYFYVYTK